MSFSSVNARKMCKHVLGTIPSACAIALTPIGERILPSKRKMAIARDTAGTGRIRGARGVSSLGVVAFRFFINKLYAKLLYLYNIYFYLTTHAVIVKLIKTTIHHI